MHPAERQFRVFCTALITAMNTGLLLAPSLLALFRIIPNWSCWIGFAVYITLLQCSLPRLNRRAAELRALTDPSQIA
jgi:hypothetical protein